ncbi:hypothetical protein M8818_002214 [Zalaria obscura]|uniref:Uncharacterized protein n=1 Tax=Zalaria obscura TaxID=2024903 RepID=A0ACC3SLD2_9PEZI
MACGGKLGAWKQALYSNNRLVSSARCRIRDWIPAVAQWNLERPPRKSHPGEAIHGPRGEPPAPHLSPCDTRTTTPA